MLFHHDQLGQRKATLHLNHGMGEADSTLNAKRPVVLFIAGADMVVISRPASSQAKMACMQLQLNILILARVGAASISERLEFPERRGWSLPASSGWIALIAGC